MIRHCPSKWDNCELLVDRVPMEFSYAPNGIKVTTHTFHTLFKSYENSWETMVTLWTRLSAVKETSLLSSAHFLSR